MAVTRLLVLTVAAVLATGNARPLLAQTCAGDCNGNGAVAVDEIVLGVRIALGDAAPGECVAMDNDGNGTVAVHELLAAVRRTLDGCASAASPTSTASAVASPTPTSTGVPTVAPAALAGAARLATDPLFRVFDLQESLITTIVVAARARRTARDGLPPVSGCQQVDCQLRGTLEVCCNGTEFSQTFDQCTFDDAGGPGTLNGRLAMSSTSSTLCSGAIPLDASFVLTLDSFTHDIAFAGGGRVRSFHQFTERYDMAPSACTLSPPDFFGLAVRGTGERRLDGVLQHFLVDSTGAVTTDFESEFAALDIAVGGTETSAGCNPTATVNGRISGADYRAGTQATVDLTDFAVGQEVQDDGTLLLRLDGTAASDCLGAVALSTVEPLRLQRAKPCFESGRLAAQQGARTVSARYGNGGALDLDFDGDGSPDQHFARCTDVTLDQCPTNAVGVCGGCTASDQCQRGLVCSPCSGECADAPRRCGFADSSITCEDGQF